jgi:hypothetical protein
VRTFYGSTWDEGREPFWNGNLAHPIAFKGGLEWQVAQALSAGYDVAIERAPNGSTNPKPINWLHLSFDGTANVNATFVSHGLLVEPGRTYLLRCQARARTVTTDNGPYLALSMAGEHPATIRSRMLTESGNWQLELQFTMPPDCGWAELAIRRDLCSRLNNKIKGEAWLGNFSLEPGAPIPAEDAGKR